MLLDASRAPQVDHATPGLPVLPRLSDPWLVSQLPPFARARRFLEHTVTLSPHAWAGVFLRADDVDPTLRRSALQHVGELLTMHARRRACDALLQVAHDAVDAARDGGRLATHDVQRAASLARASALALVVRDRLPAVDYEALHAPFAIAMDHEPSAGDSSMRAHLGDRVPTSVPPLPSALHVLPMRELAPTQCPGAPDGAMRVGAPLDARCAWRCATRGAAGVTILGMLAGGQRS